MIEQDTLFHHGGLSDNQTCSMVDKDPSRNFSPRMNLNLGPKAPKLTVHPSQELKTMLPQKVRNAVGGQSLDARVGQKYLSSRPGCRVIFFYNIYGFFPPTHILSF